MEKLLVQSYYRVSQVMKYNPMGAALTLNLVLELNKINL